MIQQRRKVALMLCCSSLLAGGAFAQDQIEPQAGTWKTWILQSGRELRLTAPAGGDAVTAWNANAGVAATAACIAPLNDPFHESRIYAMMHVAIHDALNAIDRRSRPYTFDMQ